MKQMFAHLWAKSRVVLTAASEVSLFLNHDALLVRVGMNESATGAWQS